MKFLLSAVFAAAAAFSGVANAQGTDTNIAGVYKAVLLHEGTTNYQFAKITLRTVNVAGQIKISANTRVFFGDWNSNEFMTYEYDDVPLNILTRQVSIRSEDNDVSMVGFLRNGIIEGDWFSQVAGRVGTFKAVKAGEPDVPVNGTLVTTLSGFYRGTLTNTNPASNLPERMTMSFVTVQDTSTSPPTLTITGNARFYLGGFDSLEYVETPFTQVTFNFYTRYLTARTTDYGITLKGTIAPDGRFQGIVNSDGLGEVGTLDIARVTR